jgi:hypothetical protein
MTNGIWRSLWIVNLETYQGALVTERKNLDWSQFTYKGKKGKIVNVQVSLNYLISLFQDGMFQLSTKYSTQFLYKTWTPLLRCAIYLFNSFIWLLHRLLLLKILISMKRQTFPCTRTFSIPIETAYHSEQGKQALEILYKHAWRHSTELRSISAVVTAILQRSLQLQRNKLKRST